VTQNIHSEMVGEVRILVTFQRAQERLKEVLEMPDQGSTRVIRSCKKKRPARFREVETGVSTTGKAGTGRTCCRGSSRGIRKMKTAGRAEIDQS
jgi:hypothetical protein